MAGPRSLTRTSAASAPPTPPPPHRAIFQLQVKGAISRLVVGRNFRRLPHFYTVRDPDPVVLQKHSKNPAVHIPTYIIAGNYENLVAVSSKGKSNHGAS